MVSHDIDSFAPVSVVIPCYRSSKTISRAVESVYNQTLKPKEIIIIDDFSNDETCSHLNKLENQYGKWLRIIRLERNVGAASARNIGWDSAKQTYIAFLDSDDTWLPDKIKVQYEYMRANINIVMTGHDYSEKFSDKGDSKATNKTCLSAKTIRFWPLLLKNQFVTPSVMLKRELSIRFQSGKRFMEDHLLWLEIVLKGHQVEKLNVKLANIHKPIFGVSGLSSNMWEMEKAELGNYRYFYEQGRLNTVQLYFLQCFSLLKYLRRKLIVFYRKSFS